MDYRYFNGSIKEIVSKFGVTDMLFAHNVFVMNSDFTTRREIGLLYNKAIGSVKAVNQVITTNKKTHKSSQ